MWRLVMLMQAEFKLTKQKFLSFDGERWQRTGDNNPCASCMKLLNCLWYTILDAFMYVGIYHLGIMHLIEVMGTCYVVSAQVCYWHALAGSSKMISPSAMKWKIMQDVVESPSLHGRGGCSHMLSVWKREIGVDRPGLLGLTSGECTVANMGN